MRKINAEDYVRDYFETTLRGIYDGTDKYSYTKKKTSKEIEDEWRSAAKESRKIWRDSQIAEEERLFWQGHSDRY